MDQRGIAPLVIVAIVVVVAVVVGVGIYATTRGGGGGNIAGATSLRFNLDITAQGESTTGTVMVKNIGTNNMMLRMEVTYNLENYIWIMNEPQQKVWVYGVYGYDQWTDLSADFSTYWSEFNQSFENYQTQLGGWTGSGEYTYTDPTSGATERFYNIEVNPELADSLFVHEVGGGGENQPSGGPISIQSDDQFTSANGVTGGSGTQSDPYIIQSWSIDASSASSGNGIEIQNTTAYFIVRNCLVENGGIQGFSNVGIFLENVVNGIIENNTCGNNWTGINLFESSNNTISGNTCESNSVGISLSGSSINTISGNTCESNGWGIGLYSSSNYNTLTNNICSNNGYGIYLSSSNNNTLIGNNLLNNVTSSFDEGANNNWS
jgi:parallel beta-helix repeat protein